MMKKLLSFFLAVLLVAAACPLVTFAQEHSVRYDTLVLGSETVSDEAQGWRYDATTQTLVLSDVTIDCSSASSDGICIDAAGDLNLVLEGENTLVSKTGLTIADAPGPVVKYAGDLNISGSGTLNIVEGNFAFYAAAYDSQLVIDGGILNITHDFSNPAIDESSVATVLVNNASDTVVNGGEINSDVLFFVREMNGGSIHSYGVVNRNDVVINDGELNCRMLFAWNLEMNGGTVTVTGGNANTSVNNYLSDAKPFGILVAQSFEMNGGTVNTYGTVAGLIALGAEDASCDFNGGYFTATSDGAAVLVLAENSSELNFAKTVRIEEPAQSKLFAFETQDFLGATSAEKSQVTTICSAAVDEPYFEFDSADNTVSTNVANRVVIREYFDYSIAADETALDFDSVCFDEVYPDVKTINITNTGNREVTVTHGSADAFAITCNAASSDGGYTLLPGATLTFEISPLPDLAVGEYHEKVWFASSGNTADAQDDGLRVVIPVSFTVTEHSFGEFVSNNDATYDSDGTKTRTCALCGKQETVTDEGSKLIRNGWFDEDDGRRYYVDDEALSGWQKLGGQWYYFSAAGIMQTGWQKVSDRWYLMDENGVMQTGWQKVSGKWYLLSASGAMRTGWAKVDGKWYLLSASGAMRTGWAKVDGTWYYLNASGAMRTGWLKEGGKWYYLDSNGSMLANTAKKIGSKTYQFNASGACTNP